MKEKNVYLKLLDEQDKYNLNWLDLDYSQRIKMAKAVTHILQSYKMQVNAWQPTSYAKSQYNKKAYLLRKLAANKGLNIIGECEAMSCIKLLHVGKGYFTPALELSHDYAHIDYLDILNKFTLPWGTK